ncbi:MAG: spore coat protein CotJB [Lachnospiraceae bacterium]|nr:spore coat protein CotJB [Lachnospiraceae bacterium]MDY4971445.1 spore coat protein CotJB [Lachnospiraceae bacterium]
MINSENRLKIPPDSGFEGGNGMENHRSLAMAYVPYQQFGEIFDFSEAMEKGTVFPGLYKPFQKEACGDHKRRTETGNGQKELPVQICELGFALYDLTLFLDTHPEDSDAGALFENYLQKYREIRKEFTGTYRPLGALDGNGGQLPAQSWGQKPMPWEGGC